MSTTSGVLDDRAVQRRRTRAALTAVALAAPLVLLTLPGNWLDEDAPGALDRNVEPPHVPAALQAGVGLLTGAALLAALAVLASPAGRSGTCVEDVRVAVPLLIAAVYMAFGYRVATAAVTGANIGAGLLFMMGVVVVPTLLAFAAHAALRARRTIE